MLTIHSFVFSPIAENTYLLYNQQKDCIIIDPGCYFDNERTQLENYIVQHQLTPKYLLNTHCHLDHVFGNQFVYDTWTLQPYIHPNEQIMLNNAALAGERWGLPFTNYNGTVHYIRGGEEIKLGEDVLTILETPGHSPGHVCFYCKAQHFIIGGDVLFRASIGRYDLPGSNGPQLLKSIETQLLILPDETKVYPGHNQSTTIGFERKHNPYLQPGVDLA
jgi:hydroxyacylglutathione hydrolase